MEHVKVFKIVDRFHGSSLRDVYSNEECFGSNEFEQLSNFILWCQQHNANLSDIKPISLHRG